MRFTNGMWLAREGFGLEHPREVRDVKRDEAGVTLYCPYVPIRHRAMTVGTGLMAITIQSPMPDVLSVKLENHRGRAGKAVEFPLNRGKGPLEITQDEENITVCSGRLQVKISCASALMEFSFGGRPLTRTCAQGAGHIKGPDGETYIREQLDLGVGECIYGLGERFGPFVKNGQSIDCWNADGGTDCDQAYKNVPFFLSSAGYGVFVNDTGKAAFEIGTERASKTQFSVPGESMEYFLFGGDSLKEVLNRYTDLTGKAPLLPAWSYGLWLSTSFVTEYDEATVLSFIDGMAERGIPLSVFHFDCFWMKEYEWSSFEWDKDMFPDPEGLLRKIHERGLKVCVWINPYIGQKSPLFDEGLEKGYFVKTGDGSVWQWDLWQAGMALVDFTNPEARKWYQSKLAKLVDMGVDSFKTDFGERIPVAESFYGPLAEKYGVRFHDGSRADGMHNFYSYLYNEAVFEVLEQKKGKNEAVLFARAATAGCQKFPLHWGGDNLSSYASMAQSLRGGLSFGLSGFAYWSHDIGGFEPGCQPDIFKRWTQFGLLSSHSRYHGSSEYKVPWLYGGEAVDVTRRFVELKQRLTPYLMRMGEEAAKTGVPILRAMVLEFPDDPACRTLDMQYMLGDSLLVAPVMNGQGTVEYYLPAGEWECVLTGETKQGPGWFAGTYDYASLPLYKKAGAVL